MGCAPHRFPERPKGDQLSAFVVWAPASLAEGQSSTGQPVDGIRVRGGDILRVNVRGSGKVQMAERSLSALGSTETWSSVVPIDGVVAIRARAFATEILAPRGTVADAFIGHGSDPGFYWFELERRVLAWASGPLPAPFPEVAPPQRIDGGAFARLDQALVAGVALSKNADTGTNAARAIRRVTGLRAVRALRPPSGYPYFFDSAPKPPGREGVRTSEGRIAYEVAPGRSLELPIDGPSLLYVFADVDVGGVTQSVEVRVVEGDRVRAATGATLPRRTRAPSDPAAVPPLHPPSQERSLRRAVVHVPPGRHAYRIESYGGRAFVVPMVAVPVVHLEDANAKSEDSQLGVAHRACEAGGEASLCAFALALLGQDGDEANAAAGTLTWRASMGASSALGREVAEMLAGGGPRDPTIAMENAAARGDSAALAKLGAYLNESVDEGTRAAWARSMARGTVWQVAATETTHPSWVSLVSDDTEDEGTCSLDGADPWPEVGATEAELAATPWHGTPAVELVVSAPCDDPTPVELVVDGERIAAQPSAGRARWHVRVRGEAARVRRINPGRARVYAIPSRLSSCGARWEAIRPPHIAATSPALTFGAETQSPGVEVWLREGTHMAEVHVSSPPRPGGEANTLRVVVAGAARFAAFDEDGIRWNRVARVALPQWAVQGAEVHGGANVAVRAVVRAARATHAALSREPSKPPRLVPIDPTAILALSREILAAAPRSRGPLYLRRALLLADAGAERGALDDAAAAQSLGAGGPDNENAIDVVQRAIRPRASDVAALPEGVGAYGIEPDFDPDALRCSARGGIGIRARFQRAVEELGLPTRARGSLGTYDAVLATRAIEAVQSCPLDPRGNALVGRAFSGSRWKLRRDIRGGGGDLVGDRSRRSEALVGPGGELRPHVLMGAPFDQGAYATVDSGRHATALVSPSPNGGAVWLDLACTARRPADAVDARCPLDVEIGAGPASRPFVGEDGRARVALSFLEGRPTRLSVRLPSRRARWVALARIVFAREAPGTVDVPGIGWVLVPKPIERRRLVHVGDTLSVEMLSPGLLRVDAVALEGASKGGAEPDIVAQVGGQARSVRADGTAVVIPMPEAGRLLLRSRHGNASVAVAERVPADEEAADSDSEYPDDEIDRFGARPPRPPRTSDGTNVEQTNPALPPRLAAWFTLTMNSPAPLGPLEAALGTTVAAAGAVYGTLRSGAPAHSPPDGFAFVLAGYRRRIESIGLWTNFEVFARARSGQPTFGGDGILYADLDRIHVRLSGSLGLETQRIGVDSVSTVRIHTFAEYSWRVARDFFILPRLGYDGVYTSLRNRPATLSFVDDEVFNVYRYKRPSFLFAQALFWFAPYFNDIFYVRARGTHDSLGSRFSHAALRPGAFFVFGDLDLTGYLDVLWYAPLDSFDRKAKFEETAGIVARYDLWSRTGSLCFQPGVAAFAHIHDSGFQVNAFLNVFASERRGLRDFSSLELDFPEQRGGGVPWRGATPGGYR